MENKNGAKAKGQAKGKIVVRERSESYGSIEDMFKRKRDDAEDGTKKKGEEIFRTSKKTLRSPDVGSLGQGG